MREFVPSKDQLKAINCRKGYLAISACHGSGKTETISRRTVKMVTSDGVCPSTIAAFTFTIRAADELKSRIQKNLGSRALDASEMSIGTIDAFCLEALRKIRPEYREFRMLDSTERVAFIHGRYEDIGIDGLEIVSMKTRRRRSRPDDYRIKHFCDSFDMIMREQLDIDLMDDKTFVACYKKYRKILHDEKFLDFVTVIWSLVDLLSSGKRHEYIRSLGIKHVVVDEYQDVDHLQELLIHLLSDAAESVCVVGDGDQAIFGWRGGDARRLAKFKETALSNDGEYVELNTNYRATDKLVASTARLISQKPDRPEYKILPDPDNPNRFQRGDILNPPSFKNLTMERDFICDHIDRLLGTEFLSDDGPRQLSYDDMAILVNKNKDAGDIADALETRGIPFEVDTGAKVFERYIVVLAVDCIMYALNAEPHHALQNLVRRYRTVVSNGDAVSFMAAMRKIRLSMSEASSAAIYGPGSYAFVKVVSAMGAADGALDGHLPALANLGRAISKYERINGGMGAEQAGGLGRFVSALVKQGYLGQHETHRPGNAVRIMTVWKAKGLEFPVVFVPSFGEPPDLDTAVYVNPGLRPDKHSLPADDKRRLFYTAVTRSQKHLVLTDTRIRSQSLIVGMGPDSLSREFGPRDKLDEVSSTPRHALLTYDGVASYARCPYEYYLRHTLGFVAEADSDLDYSHNVISILYRILGTCIDEGRMTPELEIRDIVNEMFDMPLATRPKQEELLEKAVRNLVAYVENNRAEISGATGSGVEVQYILPGTTISDKAGLISGDSDPVEVTGFSAMDESRSPRAHYQRLSFHAAAVSDFLHKAVRPSVYYLDGGVRVSVDAGSEALGEIRSKISSVMSSINNSEFDGTPEKKKCMKCSFKDVCKYRKEALGSGADAE